MDEQIRQRVERGAKLLDEKRPGWWRKIRTSSLKIRRCDRCILGQLDGLDGPDDFEAAWEALGEDLDPDPACYGFNHFDGERAYTALGNAWKAVIRERRQAASDA